MRVILTRQPVDEIVLAERSEDKRKDRDKLYSKFSDIIFNSFSLVLLRFDTAKLVKPVTRIC